jgi:glycosyltransferase involved in cell wall biosynthesis
MRSNKINITFALPNLLPGGAERVMSFVAQNIDSEKFNSTLLVFGYSDEASYDIENIEVVYLEKPRVSHGILSLLRYIRKQKPHILVSAIGHLNTVTAFMSLFFPKIIFVAREVNVLSVLSDFESTNRFSLFGLLANQRFNLFDSVICQSMDMLEDFNKNFNIKKEKLVVINNPITDNFRIKTRKNRHHVIKFITVARFDAEKGHHRIIEALGRVSFNFHYTLIGRGVLQNEIFSLIKKYRLEDKITHVNFTKDVQSYLAESDLYLQGSYTEGFPNSIIESCMVGTPVLAFNAPGGINEIIYPDINGKIVEDSNEFVKELENIYDNYCYEPIKVSSTVSDRYNSDLILKKYEELFVQLYKNKLSLK